MISRIHLLIVLLIVVTCIFFFRIFSYFNSINIREVNPPIPAPEITKSAQSNWLNSSPLQLSDLRGKVVVLFVWAFD